MPVKKQITYNSGIYSITFTCTNWLPLFAISNGYDCVYNWFNYLKQCGHYIVGYTIMPNHVHVVIGFCNTGKSINTIIGNGKRFIAYEIVKRLTQNNQHDVLIQLGNARSATEIKENKLHKVFETSFDWKQCHSNTFIEQKLQYIHQNPCKGKWNLAASPIDYMHSSAKYYLTGEQGFYEVVDYRLLEDVDLHNIRVQFI